MVRAIIVGSFAYILCGFAVGIARATQIWDNLAPAGVARIALQDGLLWPAQLLIWLT